MTPQISYRHYGAYLTSYLAPQRNRVLLLACLVFSDIGLQLITPQIIRLFLDTITAGIIEDLTRIALLYIGVSVLQQGLAVWATYVGENVSWVATNRLPRGSGRALSPPGHELSQFPHPRRDD